MLEWYIKKRVLITGVLGIKGTWLTALLLKIGAEVIGLDIRKPDSKLVCVQTGLIDKITFVRGDVCDLALLKQLIQNSDCVFHLAAVSTVGASRKDPLEAYRSNTLGTATIMTALSTSLVPTVMVTTDKVYHPKLSPWKEDDLLFAKGPYSVSKACAEKIIEDWSLPNIKVARAGNVILGGDPVTSMKYPGSGRIVPDCLEALSNNRKPVIFSPHQFRPYIYGLDVLYGYLLLCSSSFSGPFNFGPLEGKISNQDLVNLICELWGTDLEWKTGEKREEPFFTQEIDWSKAKNKLGWYPRYTIKDALKAVIKWQKSSDHKLTMLELINDFLSNNMV